VGDIFGRKEGKMKIFILSSRKIIFCILAFFLFAFLTENAVGEQPKEREYWPTAGGRLLPRRSRGWIPPNY